MMKKRSCLSRSMILTGGNDGGIREFHITKKIGESAYGISYEARHGRSAEGELKEFWPESTADFTLVRTDTGNLVPDSDDAAGNFTAALEAFLEPYLMLLDMRSSDTGSGMKTFIPDFEVFRGCADDGSETGTAYIWIPAQKLKPFAALCDEIRNAPGQQPEYKLVLVAKAMASLADSIGALRSAGLTYRDISPAGFGFDAEKGELLTQTLSMLDVSMAALAQDDDSDCRKDISAVGAMLFSAVVIPESADGYDYQYKDSYFDSIGEMVRQSKLIEASESNSHPKVIHMLTEILRKSLGSCDDGYLSFEVLLADLKKLVDFILPAEYSRMAQKGEKIWAKVAKNLDRNQEKIRSASCSITCSKIRCIRICRIRKSSSMS